MEEENNTSGVNETVINVSNNENEKNEVIEKCDEKDISNVKNEEEFGISDKEIEKEGILRSNSIKETEKQEINFSSEKDKSKTSLNESVNVSRIKSNISRTSTKTSLPPPERRKSFQIRAMLRKTLSYQKRQMGTNICCVGVCPTMMIIIASLLSVLIEYLLRDLIKTEKFEYCTNEYHGNLVLPNTEKEYKSDGSETNICHFTAKNNPCSHWFGTNDYIGSFPYDIIPEYNEANINRDTLFIPTVDVDGKAGNYQYILNLAQNVIIKNVMSGKNLNEVINKGKQMAMIENYNIRNKNKNKSKANKSKRALDLSQFVDKDAIVLKYLTDNIIRPWGFVAVNKNNATEKALVGSREKESNNISMDQINSDTYNITNEGYLDYTYTRYMLNLANLFSKSGVPSIGFERLPYFEILEVENEKEVDDLLTQRIKLVNKILTNCSFDSYSEEEKKQIDLSAFKDTEEAILKSVDYMPYGFIYFSDIDQQKLKYNLVMSAGENRKLANLYTCEVCGVTPYMPFPGRGKRLAYFLTEITNSIIRKLSSNTVRITQGFRSFPELVESGLPIDLPSLIGIALFPWGVSFLLPIFVIGLVKEKEERFLVMMNMNGMKSSTYYIFVYVTNLILSVLSMTCFIVAGIISNMNMFTKTSFVVLVIVFFIWANVQVALAFVLSFFFKRNGTALISSFLVVLLSIVFSLGLNEMFETTDFYFIWAPFAFYYILSVLSSLSVSNVSPAYQLHNFIPGNKVFNATMFLVIDFIIFILLSMYFNAVIPQEFGTHKPWHLNIVSTIKKLFSKNEPVEIENVDEIVAKNPFYTEEEAEAAKSLEDDDVRAERERVLKGKYERSSPLIIKNARKEYAPRVKGGKPHVAVHSVTFAVEEGIVFGLLGPNGAGKTTLIHSLIGVYPLTNGYAKLAGFNIKTDMDQVYKRIGICPQHDILWNDLTVEEHLLFYARLKGITKDQEELAVQESMASVGLESFKTNLVSGLSGGEKRRLSIAVALVGDPKLVFLDEPTTGLDPDVRRLIWGILNEISHDRTIIITTHSMEEAEVLCHRIGIMSHGTLRCCATQLRLKELYGSGFKLSYSNQPEKYKELKSFITGLLPEGYKAIRDLASTSIYEFIPTRGLISKLFEELENNKETYGITDWGISQSSLEEVFLSIISDDDADAS